jgi:hypothetical protein
MPVGYAPDAQRRVEQSEDVAAPRRRAAVAGTLRHCHTAASLSAASIAARSGVQRSEQRDSRSSHARELHLIES